MSRISLNSIEWSDGRLIRLSVILFFVLVLIVYVLRTTEIIRFSKVTRFYTPRPAQITPPDLVQPDADDTVIFAGETVGRELTAGGLQNWTFSATENELVDLTIQPIGAWDPGFNPVIELFAPNGDLLVKSNEFAPNQPELLRGVQLPTSGEYTVWISDETFAHGGSYAFNFLPYVVKATHPQRLGLGNLLSDELAPGEMDFFVFSGAENQRVSLTMLLAEDREERFRPIAEIYTPSGVLWQTLTWDDLSQPGILRDQILPESGNYSVWIYDIDFDGAGSYSFSAQPGGSKQFMRDES